MLLVAAAAVPALNCRGEGDTTRSPCGPYGAPTTSTLEGTGFEAWEGEPVDGVFRSPQAIFPPGGDTSTVVAGRFSLTASACDAYDWQITVGAAGHQIDCGGTMSPFTPADCWCQAGSEWGARGSSGHDCAAFDGGARDSAPSD